LSTSNPFYIRLLRLTTDKLIVTAITVRYRPNSHVYGIFLLQRQRQIWCQ